MTTVTTATRIRRYTVRFPDPEGSLVVTRTNDRQRAKRYARSLGCAAIDNQTKQVYNPAYGCWAPQWLTACACTEDRICAGCARRQGLA